MIRFNGPALRIINHVGIIEVITDVCLCYGNELGGDKIFLNERGNRCL